MSDITNTFYAPAIINVTGKTATERKLSVFVDASAQAQLALVSAGGRVGKAAVVRAAQIGLVQVVHSCASANYKPLAEFLAGRTGKPMVIGSRASFESLPDQFEVSIMAAKLKKSGGYVLDKKTGAMKANAELALAMELKSICVEMVAQVAGIHADRAAKRIEATA